MKVKHPQGIPPTAEPPVRKHEREVSGFLSDLNANIRDQVSQFATDVAKRIARPILTRAAVGMQLGLVGAAVLGKKIQEVAEPLVGQARHLYLAGRVQQLKTEAVKLPPVFTRELTVLEPDLAHYDASLNLDALAKDIDRAEFLIGEYRELGILPDIKILSTDAPERYQAAWAHAVETADHRAQQIIFRNHRLIQHRVELTEALKESRLSQAQQQFVAAADQALKDLNTPNADAPGMDGAIDSMAATVSAVRMHTLTFDGRLHGHKVSDMFAKAMRQHAEDLLINYGQLWTSAAPGHAHNMAAIQQALSASAITAAAPLTAATQDRLLEALSWMGDSATRQELINAARNPATTRLSELPRRTSIALHYAGDILQRRSADNARWQALVAWAGVKDPRHLEYTHGGSGGVSVEAMNDNVITRAYREMVQSDNPAEQRQAELAKAATHKFIERLNDISREPQDIPLSDGAGWAALEKTILHDSTTLDGLDAVLSRAEGIADRARPPDSTQKRIEFLAMANRLLGAEGRNPGHTSDTQAAHGHYAIAENMLAYMQRHYPFGISHDTAKQRLLMAMSEDADIESRRNAATVYEYYLYQQEQRAHGKMWAELTPSADLGIRATADGAIRDILNEKRYEASAFQAIPQIVQRQNQFNQKYQPLAALKTLRDYEDQIAASKELIQEYTVTGKKKTAEEQFIYQLNAGMAVRIGNLLHDFDPLDLNKKLADISEARKEIHAGKMDRFNAITHAVEGSNTLTQVQVLTEEAIKVNVARDLVREGITFAAATVATAGVSTALELAAQSARLSVATEGLVAGAQTISRFKRAQQIAATMAKVAGKAVVKQGTFLHTKAAAELAIAGHQSLYDPNASIQDNIFNLGVSIVEFEVMGGFHKAFKEVWKVTPVVERAGILRQLISGTRAKAHELVRDVVFFHAWLPAAGVIKTVAHLDTQHLAQSVDDFGSKEGLAHTAMMTLSMGTGLGTPLSQKLSQSVLRSRVPEIRMVSAHQKKIEKLERRLNTIKGHSLKTLDQIAELRYQQMEVAQKNAQLLDIAAARHPESEALREQAKQLHLVADNYFQANRHAERLWLLAQMQHEETGLKHDYTITDDLHARRTILGDIRDNLKRRLNLTATMFAEGSTDAHSLTELERNLRHIDFEERILTNTEKMSDAVTAFEALPPTTSAAEIADHAATLLAIYSVQKELIRQSQKLSPNRFPAEALRKVNAAISVLTHSLEAPNGIRKAAQQYQDLIRETQRGVDYADTISVNLSQEVSLLQKTRNKTTRQCNDLLNQASNIMHSRHQMMLQYAKQFGVAPSVIDSLKRQSKIEEQMIAAAKEDRSLIPQTSLLLHMTQARFHAMRLYLNTPEGSLRRKLEAKLEHSEIELRTFIENVAKTHPKLGELTALLPELTAKPPVSLRPRGIMLSSMLLMPFPLSLIFGAVGPSGGKPATSGIGHAPLSRRTHPDGTITFDIGIPGMPGIPIAPEGASREERYTIGEHRIELMENWLETHYQSKTEAEQYDLSADVGIAYRNWMDDVGTRVRSALSQYEAGQIGKEDLKKLARDIQHEEEISRLIFDTVDRNPSIPHGDPRKNFSARLKSTTAQSMQIWQGALLMVEIDSDYKDFLAMHTPQGESIGYPKGMEVPYSSHEVARELIWWLNGRSTVQSGEGEFVWEGPRAQTIAEGARKSSFDRFPWPPDLTSDHHLRATLKFLGWSMEVTERGDRVVITLRTQPKPETSPEGGATPTTVGGTPPPHSTLESHLFGEPLHTDIAGLAELPMPADVAKTIPGKVLHDQKAAISNWLHLYVADQDRPERLKAIATIAQAHINWIYHSDQRIRDVLHNLSASKITPNDAALECQRIAAEGNVFVLLHDALYNALGPIENSFARLQRSSISQMHIAISGATDLIPMGIGTEEGDPFIHGMLDKIHTPQGDAYGLAIPRPYYESARNLLWWLDNHGKRVEGQLTWVHSDQPSTHKPHQTLFDGYFWPPSPKTDAILETHLKILGWTLHIEDNGRRVTLEVPQKQRLEFHPASDVQRPTAPLAIEEGSRLGLFPGPLMPVHLIERFGQIIDRAIEIGRTILAGRATRLQADAEALVASKNELPTGQDIPAPLKRQEARLEAEAARLAEELAHEESLVPNPKTGIPPVVASAIQNYHPHWDPSSAEPVATRSALLTTLEHIIAKADLVPFVNDQRRPRTTADLKNFPQEFGDVMQGINTLPNTLHLPKESEEPIVAGYFRELCKDPFHRRQLIGALRLLDEHNTYVRRQPTQYSIEFARLIQDASTEIPLAPGQDQDPVANGKTDADRSIATHYAGKGDSTQADIAVRTLSSQLNWLGNFENYLLDVIAAAQATPLTPKQRQDFAATHLQLIQGMTIVAHTQREMARVSSTDATQQLLHAMVGSIGQRFNIVRGVYDLVRDGLESPEKIAEAAELLDALKSDVDATPLERQQFERTFKEYLEGAERPKSGYFKEFPWPPDPTHPLVKAGYQFLGLEIPTPENASTLAATRDVRRPAATATETPEGLKATRDVRRPQPEGSNTPRSGKTYVPMGAWRNNSDLVAIISPEHVHVVEGGRFRPDFDMEDRSNSYLISDGIAHFAGYIKLNQSAEGAAVVLLHALEALDRHPNIPRPHRRRADLGSETAMESHLREAYKTHGQVVEDALRYIQTHAQEVADFGKLSPDDIQRNVQRYLRILELDPNPPAPKIVTAEQPPPRPIAAAPEIIAHAQTENRQFLRDIESVIGGAGTKSKTLLFKSRLDVRSPGDSTTTAHRVLVDATTGKILKEHSGQGEQLRQAGQNVERITLRLFNIAGSEELKPIRQRLVEEGAHRRSEIPQWLLHAIQQARTGSDLAYAYEQASRDAKRDGHAIRLHDLFVSRVRQIEPDRSGYIPKPVAEALRDLSGTAFGKSTLPGPDGGGDKGGGPGGGGRTNRDTLPDRGTGLPGLKTAPPPPYRSQHFSTTGLSEMQPRVAVKRLLFEQRRLIFGMSKQFSQSLPTPEMERGIEDNAHNLALLFQHVEQTPNLPHPNNGIARASALEAYWRVLYDSIRNKQMVERIAQYMDDNAARWGNPPSHHIDVIQKMKGEDAAQMGWTSDPVLMTVIRGHRKLHYAQSDNAAIARDIEADPGMAVRAIQQQLKLDLMHMWDQVHFGMTPDTAFTQLVVLLRRIERHPDLPRPEGRPAIESALHSYLLSLYLAHPEAQLSIEDNLGMADTVADQMAEAMGTPRTTRYLDIVTPHRSPNAGRLKQESLYTEPIEPDALDPNQKTGAFEGVYKVGKQGFVTQRPIGTLPPQSLPRDDIAIHAALPEDIAEAAEFNESVLAGTSPLPSTHYSWRMIHGLNSSLGSSTTPTAADNAIYGHVDARNGQILALTHSTPQDLANRPEVLPITIRTFNPSRDPTLEDVVRNLIESNVSLEGPIPKEVLDVIHAQPEDSLIRHVYRYAISEAGDSLTLGHFFQQRVIAVDAMGAPAEVVQALSDLVGSSVVAVKPQRRAASDLPGLPSPLKDGTSSPLRRVGPDEKVTNYSGAPWAEDVMRSIARSALHLLSRTGRGRTIAEHPWVQSVAKFLGIEKPVLTAPATENEELDFDVPQNNQEKPPDAPPPTLDLWTLFGGNVRMIDNYVKTVQKNGGTVIDPDTGVSFTDASLVDYIKARAPKEKPAAPDLVMPRKVPLWSDTISHLTGVDHLNARILQGDLEAIKEAGVFYRQESESVGGNAGHMHMGIAAVIDPTTKTIIAVGNGQNIPRDIYGKAIIFRVMLPMGRDIIQLQIDIRGQDAAAAVTPKHREVLARIAESPESHAITKNIATKLLQSDTLSYKDLAPLFEQRIVEASEPELQSLVGLPFRASKTIDGRTLNARGDDKVTNYSGAPFIEDLARQAVKRIQDFFAGGKELPALPIAPTADFDAREAARNARRPVLEEWVRRNLFINPNGAGTKETLKKFLAAADLMAQDFKQRLLANPDDARAIQSEWRRHSAVFQETLEVLMIMTHSAPTVRGTEQTNATRTALINRIKTHLAGSVSATGILIESTIDLPRNIAHTYDRIEDAPSLTDNTIARMTPRDAAVVAHKYRNLFGSPEEDGLVGIRALDHFDALVSAGKLTEAQIREGAHDLAQALIRGYAGDQSPIAPHNLLFYAHRMLGLTERQATRTAHDQAKVWEDEAFLGFMKQVGPDEKVTNYSGAPWMDAVFDALLKKGVTYLKDMMAGKRGAMPPTSSDIPAGAPNPNDLQSARLAVRRISDNISDTWEFIQHAAAQGITIPPEEAIEVQTWGKRAAQEAPIWTLGAVNAKDAIEAVRNRHRLLITTLQIKKETISSTLATTHINDRYRLNLVFGREESAAGLQLELHDGRKRLATLGFQETDHTIDIVNYQGGHADKATTQQFHEFSGEVSPIKWLAMLGGQILLTQAQQRGKQLRWLAGDWLMNAYDHTPGHPVDGVTTVDDARRYWGQLTDSNERPPTAVRYDQAAKTFGFDLGDRNAPFHTYNKGTVAFGSEVRNHSKGGGIELDRSLETATQAIQGDPVLGKWMATPKRTNEDLPGLPPPLESSSGFSGSTAHYMAIGPDWKTVATVAKAAVQGLRTFFPWGTDAATQRATTAPRFESVGGQDFLIVLPDSNESKTTHVQDMPGVEFRWRRGQMEIRDMRPISAAPIGPEKKFARRMATNDVPLIINGTMINHGKWHLIHYGDTVKLGHRNCTVVKSPGRAQNLTPPKGVQSATAAPAEIAQNPKAQAVRDNTLQEIEKHGLGYMLSMHSRLWKVTCLADDDGFEAQAGSHNHLYQDTQTATAVREAILTYATDLHLRGQFVPIEIKSPLDPAGKKAERISSYDELLPWIDAHLPPSQPSTLSYVDVVVQRHPPQPQIPKPLAQVSHDLSVHLAPFVDDLMAGQELERASTRRTRQTATEEITELDLGRPPTQEIVRKWRDTVPPSGYRKYTDPDGDATMVLDMNDANHRWQAAFTDGVRKLLPQGITPDFPVQKDGSYFIPGGDHWYWGGDWLISEESHAKHPYQGRIFFGVDYSNDSHQNILKASILYAELTKLAQNLRNDGISIQFKITSHRKGRNDAGVLYFHAKDQDRIYQAMLGIARLNVTADRLPLFVAPLTDPAGNSLPGIGFAQHPRGGGSFGDRRIRALNSALEGLSAERKTGIRRSREEIEGVLAAALHAHGIDPEVPAFDEGGKTLFSSLRRHMRFSREGVPPTQKDVDTHLPGLPPPLSEKPDGSTTHYMAIGPDWNSVATIAKTAWASALRLFSGAQKPYSTQKFTIALSHVGRPIDLSLPFAKSSEADDIDAARAARRPILKKWVSNNLFAHDPEAARTALNQVLIAIAELGNTFNQKLLPPKRAKLTSGQYPPEINLADRAELHHQWKEQSGVFRELAAIASELAANEKQKMMASLISNEFDIEPWSEIDAKFEAERHKLGIVWQAALDVTDPNFTSTKNYHALAAMSREEAEDLALGLRRDFASDSTIDAMSGILVFIQLVKLNKLGRAAIAAGAHDIANALVNGHTTPDTAEHPLYNAKPMLGLSDPLIPLTPDELVTHWTREASQHLIRIATTPATQAPSASADGELGFGGGVFMLAAMAPQMAKAIQTWWARGMHELSIQLAMRLNARTLSDQNAAQDAPHVHIGTNPVTNVQFNPQSPAQYRLPVQMDPQTGEIRALLSNRNDIPANPSDVVISFQVLVPYYYGPLQTLHSKALAMHLAPDTPLSSSLKKEIQRIVDAPTTPKVFHDWWTMIRGKKKLTLDDVFQHRIVAVNSNPAPKHLQKPLQSLVGKPYVPPESRTTAQRNFKP